VTAAGGAVSGMPALGGYASGIGAVALPALTVSGRLTANPSLRGVPTGGEDSRCPRGCLARHSHGAQRRDRAAGGLFVQSRKTAIAQGHGLPAHSGRGRCTAGSQVRRLLPPTPPLFPPTHRPHHRTHFPNPLVRTRSCLTAPRRPSMASSPPW
jgi:hypothetical protein